MMTFASAGRTDIGCVRDRNEDAFLIHDILPLWAVADGMGGHDAGDLASRTVMDCIGKARGTGNMESLADGVKGCLEQANALLLRIAADRSGHIIGSTALCLVAEGDRACLLWAGDSRAYRLNGKTLFPLTTDHNVAQHMVESGTLAPQDARDHQASRHLTRAIGIESSVTVARLSFNILSGDVLLLCSDGLTGCLTDREIATILARPASPDLLCDSLLQAAIDAGAPDNVTMVVVVAA